MEKVNPRTLSGFMELLPKEQLKFNKMYDAIRKTYESFGFLPLDTPILEASEVLLAKAGGETEKQVYEIERGDSKVVMRFDLTVPLAKYVAMHYGELSFPFRRYQIGKVYRGERAQKGRFREFYQADIDIIGENELSIINDAEIPYIIYKVFKNIGLDKFVIKINNRKILNGYFEYLNIDNKSEVMKIIDKLKKIGIDNLIAELKELNVEKIDELISFINIDGTSIEIINKLKELNISNETYIVGLNELETVVNYANKLGMSNEYLQIDLTISRGLDYYTGTVYETFLIDYLEIGSICSGGRYDNLAEYYTDRVLPGVGISIGLTRLFDQLNELNLLKEEELNLVDVLIIPMTDNFDYIIDCYNKLLKNNIRVQTFYEKRSIKSIINYALSLNIKKVIFIGDDEVNNNTITLKNLDTHEQVTDKVEVITKEI
jgi:histidyl-tRNA synthetase